MIISHSKRFILMAPWKTASSTCHASLELYNQSTYSRFFQFNPFLNRVVHQHATLADLMALPESKMGYNIATFVRNPYDRAYSGFLQIQRDFANQPKFKFESEWIEHLVKDQIASNMSRIISAGFDFDEWMKILPEYEIFETGRNTSMLLHPCHYWTHLRSEKIVGFIGKVEKFENDFQGFCEYVGIDYPRIHLDNITENEPFQLTENSKYAARMARPTLDRINRLFEQDFEYFGYDMI